MANCQRDRLTGVNSGVLSSKLLMRLDSRASVCAEVDENYSVHLDFLARGAKPCRKALLLCIRAGFAKNARRFSHVHGGFR
jgi:hypothetical protein